MNWMTGTKQLSQILFPTTELGGAVKYSMVIANPFRTDTVNPKYTTIQPTIFHFNQETGMGHSDRNH